MDWQNLIRIVFTLLCFVFFLGVCFWAYSSRNKKDMDEAARLPFIDEDDHDSGHKPS